MTVSGIAQPECSEVKSHDHFCNSNGDTQKSVVPWMSRQQDGTAHRAGNRRNRALHRDWTELPTVQGLNGTAHRAGVGRNRAPRRDRTEPRNAQGPNGSAYRAGADWNRAKAK